MALWALIGGSALGGIKGGTPPVYEAGRSLYLQNCSGCHGENLKGGFGPPIVGPVFVQRWSGRTEEMSRYIAQKMPPRAAGSLDDATYRAIAQYVRRVAGLDEDTVATSAS